MNISPISHKLNSDFIPVPEGELTLKVIADHSSLNSSGDVFGGWVALHLDQAGELAAKSIAGSDRVVVVSIGSMSFLRPVIMGDIITFYTQPGEVGRTSITVHVEAWVENNSGITKLTEASLVFVAIDSDGRTQRIQSVY